MTVLDLIGPQQILSSLGNVEVHLVWKDRNLVTSDSGVTLQPSATFETCPKSLTLLFVPGGAQGTVACIRDPEVLDFLAERGASAGYVTSVCTGSLLLGAAGLLEGYRATSHWQTRSLLPLVGSTPVGARVVEDRNRITGAGVTAGIDFGLRVASRLRNEKYAKALQLTYEYDPQPPYQAGTPAGAGPEITGMMDAMFAPFLVTMTEAIRLARARRPVRKHAG